MRHVMDTWERTREPTRKTPFSNQAKQFSIEIETFNDRSSEDLYQRCLQTEKRGGRPAGQSALSKIFKSLDKAFKIPDTELIIGNLDQIKVEDYDYDLLI